jgi:hypothetical protein
MGDERREGDAVKRFLLLAAALSAGCAETPPTAPQPPAPPIDHTGWPALTAEPVRQPRQLFYFCAPPTELTRLGPHGVPSARYYTNPAGLDAVRRGDVPVPVGTTVLKEKRWADDDGREGVPVAFAAMVKREPGYDPADGDWEYVYWPVNHAESGPPPVERGRLATCIDCHRNAKATDYLFRTYLKK